MGSRDKRRKREEKAAADAAARGTVAEAPAKPPAKDKPPTKLSTNGLLYQLVVPPVQSPTIAAPTTSKIKLKTKGVKNGQTSATKAEAAMEGGVRTRRFRGYGKKKRDAAAKKKQYDGYGEWVGKSEHYIERKKQKKKSKDKYAHLIGTQRKAPGPISLD
eukprot:m.144726 g.144726  ORF g.144726 m.144726 type:complete len:160 (-) comp30391_c1_seq1:133-612(-)